jgi:predicted nucleotidyltransferase
MSQKDYKEGIMKELLLRENHIRGIAKVLNTNQTTIARKANELHKENIIDFKIEGKNKILLIKKTLEARQYLQAVESHKLILTLNKYPQLRRIFEQIKNNKKITLAVLFGSYAKGNAGKESDIDIYIDSTDKKIKEEVEMIDSKISVKIGNYDSNSLLIKEIEENHVIIKGVEAYYERQRFFD